MKQLTLKAARVNAGLSVQYVADELGITSATIYNYEKGETIPRADDLIKLAKLYGVPVESIKISVEEKR